MRHVRRRDVVDPGVVRFVNGSVDRRLVHVEDPFDPVGEPVADSDRLVRQHCVR